MEQSLEEVKANVAKFQRKVTNFDNFIQNFNEERDLIIIEKRKNDVDIYFSAFKKWQTLLELYVVDDNHAIIRNEYEDKYNFAYSQALNFLSAVSTTRENLNNLSANGQDTNWVNQLNTNHISNANLPRLNLPSFDESRTHG